MKSISKYIALAIAIVVPFALVSQANAADETVSATTTLSPKNGPFYKEKSVASDLKIDVRVNTPVTSPKVNPLKNVKIEFPAGMTFKPNDKKTPVCPDSKLSERSNLADPLAVLDSCKTSVVGTGKATIIIGKINNNPALVVDDPILIAFNAGKTSKGEPKLKIYGFSDYTNVGILMSGTLRGRILDIAVPVLSSDSAVRFFDLEFPGPPLDRPELGISTQGLDPNYVQARCASSPFVTNATFELGERNYPGGTPTTPTTTVVAPESTQNCVGNAGKARLGAKVVKKPRAVKNGRKGLFRISVKNNGTASAQNVVVTGPGLRKRIGKLAPGASRTVGVKAKVRGRKGGMARVKFVVKGKGVTARAATKVRVK